VAAAAIAVSLGGCGVGCLYGETGKVIMPDANSSPRPERVVEVIGEALRPMGFTGHAGPDVTPKPAWYWDYGFSVGVGKFSPPRVDVNIRYEDLSISLADYAGGSSGSAFDRTAITAIQARLRSELGADITFTPLQQPAFCLGP
jgi:hypothetical protein